MANVLIPKTEKIVLGAGAKSETINDLTDNILVSLSSVDTAITELENNLNSAVILMTAQNAAIATITASLSGMVSNSTIDSAGYADFFVSDYVGEDTNANMVNLTYGQVTLPVTSTQEKLTTIDVYGKVWIPVDSKVYYVISEAEPDDTAFVEDANGKYALDDKPTTVWYRSDAVGESEFAWIKVDVPMNSNLIKNANAIVIHPFPEFGVDLYGVDYYTGAGWQAADISYISGYDGTVVRSCGKCRIWIPFAQVSKIRIKMKPKGDIYGLQKVSVQLVEFDTTGNLVVDFDSFSPGTLATVVIYGKDMATLAYLQKSTSTTFVTVGLSQLSAFQSPVITGVKAVW